ncbi:hypothetical protein [Novosphingobium sp. 9]|uniref:hypothetical protein n=1 Tax=Novosphingobium sp. 9 TaxID=2025349 RepID=UPI0021B5A79E|nr:hypothetical protein [Novosphingobium sp. 9]
MLEFEDKGVIHDLRRPSGSATVEPMTVGFVPTSKRSGVNIGQRTQIVRVYGDHIQCDQRAVSMAHLSIPMMILSAFGLIVVASTILGDYGLTTLGKYSLRAIGVAFIGIGLMLA